MCSGSQPQCPEYCELVDIIKKRILNLVSLVGLLLPRDGGYLFSCLKDLNWAFSGHLGQGRMWELVVTKIWIKSRSQAAYNLEGISTLVKIMNYVMDKTQGYKKSTEGSEMPKEGERDCSWGTLGSLPGGGDIMIIRIICSSSSSSMGRVYFLFQRCKVWLAVANAMLVSLIENRVECACLHKAFFFFPHATAITMTKKKKTTMVGEDERTHPPAGSQSHLSSA